ncbi:hypothetical protein M885DRAFT_514218 [Pelagophyceae sp. CCMP2097]|nr:hypothetical protein M885DRAFT_514218 [Pelagophyceae sp. CCMP2097]
MRGALAACVALFVRGAVAESPAVAEAPVLIESYPVEGSLNLRDKTQTLATTTVVLNGDEYRTYTRLDGSFVFHDVKPGVYLLDVLSTEFVFSQVKINLPSQADQQVRCLEYKYPGAAKNALAYPIRLDAHLKYEYFDKREQVGLHTLLQNPMYLMIGVTAILVFLMPKLMESMDPEEMKKMQEQMGSAQDPASMLKTLFGGGEEENLKEEKESKKIK